MRKLILLVVLLSPFHYCPAQKIKELPALYFLNVPVTHTYTSMINFIANSPELGVDSIGEDKRTYSSLKKPLFDFAMGSQLVKLYVNYALDFGTGDGVADTVNSIMISYYYSSKNKSEQKRLYKKFLKDFSIFFSNTKHYKGESDTLKYESTVLKQAENSLYPRLVIHKVFDLKKGLHVTLLFEVKQDRK